jgi:dUTP pyrophosphatase
MGYADLDQLIRAEVEWAMLVRIRRLDSSIPLPAYQTPGAAGFDLAAAADVEVPAGRIALVSTGLVIEVPAGYWLGIFARSSTPLKRGLMVANGVGVIDPDYCGPADEVKIQVLNFTDELVQVKRGDRIAQGLLIPLVRAEWHEMEGDLRQGSRGGFGATGA